MAVHTRSQRSLPMNSQPRHEFAKFLFRCTFILLHCTTATVLQDIDKAREEIRVLSQISSKNVLKYYDSFSEKVWTTELYSARPQAFMKLDWLPQAISRQHTYRINYT